MKMTRKNSILWATLLTVGLGLSACSKTADKQAEHAEKPVPVAQEQHVESEVIAPVQEAVAEPQKETVEVAEIVRTETPPPVAKPELTTEAEPVREIVKTPKPTIEQPVKKTGQPVKAEIVERIETPTMPVQVREKAPEAVQDAVKKTVEAVPNAEPIVTVATPAPKPAPKPEPVIPQTYVTKITHVDALGSRDVLAADENVVILDIRTPKEFNAGHLKGAVNVDFYADDFEQQLSKLDKSTEYLLHCRSGGRSNRSLKTFKKLGFKHIIHMDGGIKAWNKAHLPTTK